MLLSHVLHTAGALEMTNRTCDGNIVTFTPYWNLRRRVWRGAKATLEKHKYFKGRKLNTFRNLFHSVNHERPLQAGDGSLGYGDGDRTLNSKKR